MHVRLASPADLPAIKSLERSSDTAAHWVDNEYGRLFTAELRRVVLIAEAEQVDGFLIGKVIGPDAEVENIVVAENCRRRGVGLRLLHAFLEEAGRREVRTVFLEVRESNDAARKLYKACGFHESGRRRGYYREPLEDAVLYQMCLAESS